MTEPPAAPRSAVPLVPLPGSEKPHGLALPSTGERHAQDTGIEVTVLLRRRAGGPPPPSGVAPLDAAAFAAEYGADPADIALTTQVLASTGLSVISSDPASRRLRVAGTIGAMEQTFGTELARAPDPNGTATFRLRSGGLSVPEPLAGIVTAVLGLDDTPQSRANFRIAVPAAVSTSYTPVQLGAVYDFPAGTDGTGQTIAIIELGGGFAQSDLDTYFEGLGLSAPTVTAVSVDGAQNQPGGDPTGADGEVLLDIEVAGALAPKATLVVYFAPNTDAGFLDAVAEATQATPTPTAMSISWGQYEEAWSAQSRTAMDDAFADAVALGITVTAAAGDDGSADRAGDGAVHADFPASSPHVLACGGTSLDADASGTVRSETVWNDGTSGGATGGGVSTVFALPDWQRSAGVPPTAGSMAAASGTAGGRGVPDVAAVADPRTGYQVLVDGKAQVIGGTSAVAPLWAALVARLAQHLDRKIGLIQPALYAGLSAGRAPAGFRDIIDGDNGGYRAGAGWDACTGLGVPVGSALAAALQKADQS
ncbi:MAG: S53 family peptidase [Jatrophihabitans sp.]